MTSKRRATKARRISREEAEALIQSHAGGQYEVPVLGERDFEEADGSTWVRHYEGRTVVDGNFAVEARVVLVSGDLVVRGCLSDAARHDNTLLIVLGDVEVESAMFYSAVWIAGSLRANGLVYANSLCDHTVRVGGEVKVRALIEEGSYFSIAGALAAGRMTPRTPASSSSGSTLMLPSFADARTETSSSPSASSTFETSLSRSPARVGPCTESRPGPLAATTRTLRRHVGELLRRSRRATAER